LQKIKLLKTVFTIGATNEDSDTLLLEIGGDYCCSALLKHKERSFQSIRYITYGELEAEKSLGSFLEELNNNYEKVLVCSAFHQSLLIPESFHGHPSLFHALYDTPLQKKLTADISERQMNAAYSIPASIFNLITEKFSSAQFLHVYTPALKIGNGFAATDQIDIHFSTRHFRVLLKKDRQVQLAQIYSYKTPLDVVYFLLKICYEFGLNQSKVVVILSGLIDEDSAMYTELHNYFLNLHFTQAPSYSVPENSYPHHYFTSLYNLAACVS
jgi:Protein of unknown function (DUF3822)